MKPEMFPVDDIQSPVDVVLIQLEHKDKLEHVQFIIDRLPDQYKNLIRMKIWEGLSDEEIEQQTGLKKGNIKVIVSRARKIVKEFYQQWEKDGKTM
jgi:RNA polymerase sigma-70 factor (ECF subfamily)